MLQKYAKTFMKNHPFLLRWCIAIELATITMCALVVYGFLTPKMFPVIFVTGEERM